MKLRKQQQKNLQEKPAGNFWALRYEDKSQALVVAVVVVESSAAVDFVAVAVVEIEIAAAVETPQEIASPLNWVSQERSGQPGRAKFQKAET